MSPVPQVPRAVRHQYLATIATSFFRLCRFPRSACPPILLDRRPPVFLPPHRLSSRAQRGICSSAFAFELSALLLSPYPPFTAY